MQQWHWASGKYENVQPEDFHRRKGPGLDVREWSSQLTYWQGNFGQVILLNLQCLYLSNKQKKKPCLMYLNWLLQVIFYNVLYKMYRTLHLVSENSSPCRCSRHHGFLSISWKKKEPFFSQGLSSMFPVAGTLPTTFCKTGRLSSFRSPLKLHFPREIFLDHSI